MRFISVDRKLSTPSNWVAPFFVDELQRISNPLEDSGIFSCNQTQAETLSSSSNEEGSWEHTVPVDVSLKLSAGTR